MMKKIAAFFDIDGTLYREGLITEIFKKFLKYEIIEPERWYNEVKPDYVKWDKRIGSYDNYLLRVAGIYIDAIKGLHKSHVDFIAKHVIKKRGDRVYTYTRNKIKWHKDQGHVVITISGSPIELVREMSVKYGFDDYIGTEYLTDENQLYTGELIPMWDSTSKKNALLKFAKKYNIDLTQSYAYGDTSGDYSMFNSVRYPTATNPTKELLAQILKNDKLKSKINIVVERKDVIYRISPDSIHLLP